MNKKSLFVIGVATFTVMLFMAVLFFKERTVFLDISYHLFFILKDGDFAIQNFRFGAFFTQLFPLLGSKLGLPLSDIALSYSVSFVLLYLITFLIILKGIKNEKLALCYLLFNTLMVRHTFFWIQSELPQATAFAFIYFALLYQALDSEKFNLWANILMVLLLIVVGFTHPLMPFLVLFTLLFFAVKFPRKWVYIVVQAAVFIMVYVVKSKFFRNPYDLQATNSLWKGVKRFPHYFDLQANINFLKYLIQDYYLILLLLIVVCLVYVYRKQYFLLMLSAGAFIAYVLMINLSEPNGADQFYIENRYVFMSAFVILPFVFDILPWLTIRKKDVIIVSAALAISMVSIFQTHHIYTVRLQWNRNFLEKTSQLENKKLIVASSKIPKDTLMMFWGAPYESWLLSTMEQGVSRSFIVEEQEHEHQFDGSLTQKKAIQTMWGIFAYSDFTNQYFNFTDTSTTYVKY